MDTGKTWVCIIQDTYADRVEILGSDDSSASSTDTQDSEAQAAAEEAAKKEEGMEQACFFERHVVPAMEHLRRPVDQLEMIVDKNIWPMPSYGDLLFEV